MPSHLKPTQIAILGDFGPDATLTNIKRWIAHAGGTYTSRVTNKTTHLVCSAKNWEAKTPVVTNAIQKYGKKIAIVNYDWLEDCLMKKRCYHARKYDWRKDGVKRSRLEERLREIMEGLGVSVPVPKVEVEKKISVETELSKARYSIYEENGRKYDIALIRYVPEKNFHEKYRIRLYVKETAKSRFYATTMTYYKIVDNTISKVSKTEYLGGAEPGSTWKCALESLTTFVQKKTGVIVQELLNGKRTIIQGEWRVRLCGQGGKADVSISRGTTVSDDVDQEENDGDGRVEDMEQDE